MSASLASAGARTACALDSDDQAHELERDLLREVHQLIDGRLGDGAHDRLRAAVLERRVEGLGEGPIRDGRLRLVHESDHQALNNEASGGHAAG